MDKDDFMRKVSPYVRSLSPYNYHEVLEICLDMMTPEQRAEVYLQVLKKNIVTSPKMIHDETVFEEGETEFIPEGGLLHEAIPYPIPEVE